MSASRELQRQLKRFALCPPRPAVRPPAGQGWIHKLCYGLVAAGVLLANSAFAGDPVLVDGNGHALVFDTASRLQKEWNAYVKIHGVKRGSYIYTPYSAKFHRGGIHCDDTGTNISPSCDVENTTIYGGP